MNIDGGLLCCCSIQHFGCANVLEEHCASIFRDEVRSVRKWLRPGEWSISGKGRGGKVQLCQDKYESSHFRAPQKKARSGERNRESGHLRGWKEGGVKIKSCSWREFPSILSGCEQGALMLVGWCLSLPLLWSYQCTWISGPAVSSLPENYDPRSCRE